MSKTAVKTSVNITAKAPPMAARLPQRKQDNFVIQCLKAAASLRITVVLLAVSILLVFLGTLAQVDEGIGTVLHKYFRAWFSLIPLQVFVRFGQTFFGVSQETQLPGAFPFPGGWTLGALLLANLLAAHAVRFKLSWKRSGILVLHSGVVVMMLGELVTGLFAVESRMTIAVGESVNFIDVSSQGMLVSGSPRELALVDSSDPDKDHVVAIPSSMLEKGKTISDPSLPVDIEVLEFWPNSGLVLGEPTDKDVFVNNEGVRYAIREHEQVNGVDPGGHDDVPSVRVTFKKKDTHESLGSYLLSLWHYPNFTIRQIAFPPQQLQVDGKTYTVSFRPRRIYEPYTLHLTDFKHGKYPGTETPKDFVSTVRLKESETQENRSVKISMNNPLIYAGETFYQSGYFQDDGGTVLQVVHNPGKYLPYTACFLVVLGMLVHFGMHLVGFMQTKLAGVPPVEGTNGKSNGRPLAAQTGKINAWSFVVPGAVLACFVLSLCVVLGLQEVESKRHYDEAGKIPVQDGGRVKPLDTLASTSLMVISSRSTFRDEKKKEHSAVEWLFDVMAGGHPLAQDNPASKYKVFRIENIQLLDFLHLPYRPGSWRYSIREMADKLDAASKEAERALAVEEKKRTLFETKLLELRRHLDLYYSFAALSAPGFVPPRDAGDDWKSLPAANAEVQNDEFARVREAAKKKGLDLAKIKDLPHEQLLALQAEMKKAREEAPPELTAMMEILSTHGDNDPERFNEALARYLTYLDTSPKCDMGRVKLEAFFDHLEPFYLCIVFYWIVFGLAVVGLLVTAYDEFAGQTLCKAAFWLAVFTLVLHSASLIARMYIQARPPVTNLYSAAVWIGWGAVLLGLILEAIHRNGIGLIAAAVPGFLTMHLAHHLAGGGDTLEMMQAVLDTNFWLATHVTVVTFGYVATVVAGVLGLIYVTLGALTPSLNRDKGKVLAQMIYAVLCFATLLSFTGTVLGGLWADYSWGRFWGWDPKENGALIIVLWNVLILHARWGGLIKQRGMAVLSIVGIMVTGWSFIGTNQLGVGLHAYGFNNTLAMVLDWTWAASLALIVMGLAPRRLWLSPRT